MIEFERRRFARQRAWALRGCVAAAVLAVALVGCQNHQVDAPIRQSENTQKQPEVATPKAAFDRETCTTSTLATARGEAKLGMMIAARSTLYLCREYFVDGEPKRFVDKVFAAAELEDARERKRSKAAATAKKKREGVSIGMSQQDVRDSSWGRPRDINRTIGSYGTHEQWVYDGGYLYFENGILKTIQN